MFIQISCNLFSESYKMFYVCRLEINVCTHLKCKTHLNEINKIYWTSIERAATHFEREHNNRRIQGYLETKTLWITQLRIRQRRGLLLKLFLFWGLPLEWLLCKRITPVMDTILVYWCYKPLVFYIISQKNETAQFSLCPSWFLKIVPPSGHYPQQKTAQDFC